MTAINVLVLASITAVSMVVILVVVKRSRPETRQPSDPMRVLEVRLARGEITTDEYHEQRCRLGPPPSPGAHHRGDSTATEQ